MKRHFHLAGALVVLASNAVAQTVAPGLSATLTYSSVRDSNVLRLPDGVTPNMIGFDTSDPADTVLSPALDVDFLLAWSRQQVRVSAKLLRQHFHEFSQYDTRLQDYSANWLWAAGNEWAGDIGASYNEQATGFEYYLGPQRNILTLRHAWAIARWSPRPDRRVVFSYDDYDGTNSALPRRSSDFRLRAPRVAFVWQTGQNNEVALSYRHTDGSYPNKAITAGGAVDNSYTQDDAEVGVAWLPGGRTQLDARAGWGVRRYESLSYRDFAGPVGRLILTHALTGKTTITLAAIRDLNAVEDLDALYAVGTTALARARVQLTYKVAVVAEASEQRLRYEGDPGPPYTASTDKRRDDTRIQRFALEWQATPRLALIGALEYSSRQSTQPTLTDRTSLGYHARTTTFTAQYALGPW